MTPETQRFESPYCVRIETESGKSSTVPIAVLTPKQLEVFLQSEFKRLAQEAGVKGARIQGENVVKTLDHGRAAGDIRSQSPRPHMIMSNPVPKFGCGLDIRCMSYYFRSDQP